MITREEREKRVVDRDGNGTSRDTEVIQGGSG